MNKILKIIAVIVVFIVAGLTVFVLSSLFNTSTFIHTIKPSPNSILVGEFKTTYPDSKHGDGIIYESISEPEYLSNYYKKQLVENGWYITDIHKFDDYGKTVVITSVKGWMNCYLTISNTKTNRRITIKIE